MKTGLAFSGGKDSWACLWLNKHRLGEIYVIWVNTGKNFPELLETVEKAKAICPNFIEVLTDRVGQNKAMGLPADVVPIDWTALGQRFNGPKPVTVQSYLGCCYDNISGPLHQKCLELGLEEIIRGQRLEDDKQGTARDGTVLDGVTCSHPIESWTTAEVLAFNALHMEIPEHFSLKHSSMDCYDCTAYLKDSADRVAYTKANHPILYQEYKQRASALNDALLEAQDGEYLLRSIG